MFERGYVAAKSGHSRGSTIDLTLYHLSTGELAPMGGDHDLMDPISHHGAQGITPLESRNRRYLCSVMEDSGFISYPCEWWHYSLKDEPYPDTYFDFPVGTALTMRPQPRRSVSRGSSRAALIDGDRPAAAETSTASPIQSGMRL